MMLEDMMVGKIAGHSGEQTNVQQKVRAEISKWFINHMKEAAEKSRTVSVSVFTPVSEVSVPVSSVLDQCQSSFPRRWSSTFNRSP
ncbi:unnamed protein product [Cyprideis torosa]|uniref:Uncharacterized protein n=1 Tax=Cyprideis torosa TaxID=163714 RepID=A0A7R8WC55_9CRUS|nr:unnamed protein product [Cyprideis torosa]CAG0893020.1 unnamed protein product [Cyprideis torosa]